MKRKITKKRKRQEKGGEVLRSSLMDAAPLDQLFGHLHVSEITVRISSDYPRGYQAVAKFRDANRPWAVGLAEEPEAAVYNCAQHAIDLETETPGLQHPEVKFYQRREAAADAERKILDAHPGILASAVQFEPYKGFLVVVWVPDPYAPEYAELARVSEVREMARTPEGGTSGRKGSKPPKNSPENASNRGRGGNPPKSGGPAALPGSDDLRTWTKAALIALHVERHGKQPNSAIKKADLAEMLMKEQG